MKVTLYLFEYSILEIEVVVYRLFFLYSFTHYLNLTFLFFSSTVYRSYNRNSEKKILAFRFSAWARHVSVTSHRKEKTKYTATDMTSKWRRMGRGEGRVSKARREVSMRLDRVNRPLSIPSFILFPFVPLLRCIAPFFILLLSFLLPCNCDVHRISSQLDFSVNAAGESSDF